MIAAAGSGQRLGVGGPKAYAALAGRPLLAHSLSAAAGSGAVGTIIVAAPGEQGPARALLAEELRAHGGGLEGEVVAGGQTRAESVRAALARCDGELVAIHDAARPLAPAALFDAVLERLHARPDADAVIAATPLTDTVKRAVAAADADAPPRVEATLERELLWAAQTPQAFRVEALRAAQERAVERGELDGATDEASLIERGGGTVLIEPAPASNLKVTTGEDLAVAAALLAERGR